MTDLAGFRVSQLSPQHLICTNRDIAQPAGDSAPTGPSVASGSSITACNDQGPTRTDYVFYRSTSGSLVCGISAAERGFTAFHTLSQATSKNGTKLASWYDDRNGDSRAVLYYQDGTEGILRFLQIRRTGDVDGAGIVSSAGK